MAGQDQHSADGGTGAVRPGAISALLQEIAAAPTSAGEAWESGLRPGAVVGRFELVRELGRGGFGVVWEARDRELGRKVAFKAVRAGSQRDLREERLLREAEAAARLSHPNIVTLFDVGRAEQGPYLVLELLEGQTLAERLSEGTIPPAEAVRVAAEVGKGLAHAHSHGVVHRDLKPENVFLCRDGQVKVLDFGLAHAFGQRRQEGGTSGYMAPEQVEGAPEDERTDVWALGAMLFEMLSGRRPYGEARPRGPAPVLEVPGAPALRPLVARMLERRPVDRPRDAGEVLQALDEVAEHPQLAAGPVRALRRPRLRLAGLVALAVLAGAAIAGAVAWWRTSRAPGAGDGRVLVAVADVVNETGERELDVLSGLLVTSLEQSRRLSVMTQARVLDLAIRAGRKDASRVDETIGREVGQAQAVRALLLPAIRRLGTTYSLEMRAVDPGRDEHLFTLSDRATSKETLLDMLDRLSERTRTELGERRGDVAKARVQLSESVTRSLEAYQHYLAGLQAWSRDGLLAVGLREYQEALRLDPAFAAAHSDLAFLYYAYGRPDLAVPHWKAADQDLARMPEKERSVLRLRRSFATPSSESWSREEGLRLAGEVVKRFPDDKYVLDDAADAFFNFHKNDLRDAALRQALDLDPGFFVSAEKLSRLLGDRTAEALEVARRAVATRRGAANLSLLAVALHANGATEEAVAVAREALKADGGRSSLIVQRACFTLYQSGRDEECAPIWRRIAAEGQNPLERDYASARLIEALFVGGRVSEGLRAMRSLEEPRRGGPGFLVRLLLIGRPRLDAPLALEQARKIPYAPARRHWLARLGAMAEAERADSTIPDQTAVFATWNVAYQSMRAAAEGRYAEAAEAARRASEMNRSLNNWLWRYLGASFRAEMLLAAGRPEEAAKVWPAPFPCRCRDPIDYAAGYPSLAIFRARAMEKLGRHADAVRELDGVIAFWKEADADLPLLVEAKAMRRRLAAAPTPAGQRAAAAQAKAPAPSIAVLPFADMSPGRDQEYFADGVAEEILNALGRVQGLKVIGRTSSFSFKGKSDGLRSIGKKLDVAHVLEGSLRQSGKRVRITAQLVRAADGSQLWSQTYDRTLDDIFEVQGSIAKAVVAALEVKLLPGRKAEYRTANQDAYASYLLGRRFAQSVSEDGQRRAIAAFEKAVELDPGYPPAWAALALARLRAGQIAALPWAEARRGCLAAAGRAIELAPDLAEGLAARAHCRLSDWDWAGAKADIDRSFALDPEDLRGLRAKAAYLYVMGAKFPEAVELGRRIVEKDPLDGQAWNALGLGYWATGRLDSARAAFSRAVEVDPRHVVAPVNRAMLELEDGRPAEALAACQKLEDPEGKSDARRRYSTALCLACSHHALGHAVESRQALQTVLDRATNDEWFMGIAVGYACRGQVDEAFEWLERSYRGHGRSLVEIKAVAVHLGAIRSDPRYKALLRKMNLPVD